MKVENAGIPITDFIKVWCENCGIRIDPYEERTVLSGKIYHLDCDSKHISAVPTPKG